MNTRKLRPSSRGEVKYFDILIDTKPLAEYFAGRLGAIPDLIPPLGPAQPGTEQYRREQFARFLLERTRIFPKGETPSWCVRFVAIWVVGHSLPGSSGRRYHSLE